MVGYGLPAQYLALSWGILISVGTSIGISGSYMRILAFPKNKISYNECFYQAMEAHGVEVLEGVFSGGWLVSNVRAGDWLHIHWPSFSYSVKQGKMRLIVRFFRFTALFVMARLKGARVVWTAHNLLPHDRAVIPWLDVLGRQFIVRIASVVLVHGREAAAALIKRFPIVKEKITLIPHGHWIGYYPATLTRDEARAKLDIPQAAFVYLFIGLCKPYKNLDGLVRVFRAHEQGGILLIAGKFQDPAYHAEIVRLAGNDCRIRIHAEFIPDAEMQTFLLACDVVVVPYREILTSGTAMLAMSFGRPVVSIDRGFLRDVVTVETGLLFSPEDPQGLSRALAEVHNVHYDSEQILAHARKFSFEQAAVSCIKALEKVSGSAVPSLSDAVSDVSVNGGEAPK